MEEREELMVSPSRGGDPTVRTAHFLKPSITSTEGPVFELPTSPFCSETATHNVVDLPLKVAFKGCQDPLRKWKGWVDRMHSLHQSTWKQAGVYEAIINSTYQIRINKDIVLCFANRWCSETKSFVFDWGEVTISLEDVTILGGYSVLGDSVLSPLETEELVETNKKLMKARSETFRTKNNKGSQHVWMDLLMGSGSEIEHEAFLVIWLSRHVFPFSFNLVNKHVHHIAIHLARGRRIALAPAVLSWLYRDLRFLREAIVAASSAKKRDADQVLDVWSQMQLVQIWAWERFPTLSPLTNSLKRADPRMARWNKVKQKKIGNVGSGLDSVGECFRWRPYAIFNKSWMLPKFYRESEEWVSVCPGMDEDLESFARYLRVSELVGPNCVEQYLPHRVARQFGMDQDLPGRIARSSENPEIAWNNYSRPIRDDGLYVPSRLFESGVTTRYEEWWKQSKLAQKNVFEGIKRQKKTSRSLGKLLHNSKGNIGSDASIPPPKRKRIKAAISVGKDEHDFAGSAEKRIPSDVPPPKRKRTKAANSVGKDKHRLVASVGNRMTGDGECFLHSGAGKKKESQKEPGEGALSIEAALGRSYAIKSKAGISGDNGVNINNNEGKTSTQAATEIPGLELEARISRLEMIVARLKQEK